MRNYGDWTEESDEVMREQEKKALEVLQARKKGLCPTPNVPPLEDFGGKVASLGKINGGRRVEDLTGLKTNF